MPLPFTLDSFTAMLLRGEIDACRALLDGARASDDERLYLTCRADFLRRSGDMRGSFAACIELSDRYPGWDGHRYTLADVAAHLGRIDEALPAVDKIARGFIEPLGNQMRAEAWYAMGRDREVLTLHPGRDEPTSSNYLTRLHVAQSAMRLSGIGAGIAEYAATWTAPPAWRVLGYLDDQQGLWWGQCAPPRRLRVTKRGGIGDWFLWSRYLPWLQAAGVEIIHDTGMDTTMRPEPLERGHLPVSFDDLLPAPLDEMWADPFALFTSLFGRFGHAPRRGGFRAPANESADAIARAARARAAGKPCIALFWSANESHGNFALKSACLPHVLPLLERDDVHWVVLQRGYQMKLWLAHPLHGKATNVTTALSIDELAALLPQLDAAVVVDTAIAHIAAALGVPTWLLASRAACWRYEHFEQLTPWYQSLRLFRQPALGDWDGAVRAISAAL